VLTEEQFDVYDAENPKVYPLFERFALEAIGQGKMHLGAKMIWERMRWYAEVETRSDDGYKLNNNYTAFYARKFMELHPEYRGFFSCRVAAADGTGVVVT